MNRSAMLSIVAATAIAAVSIGVAQAQKKAGTAKKVVYISSDHSEFKSPPNISEVSMAAVRGDRDKGPHATFTKFKPGYDAGVHTHTADTTIVGIKGAYLYKDDDGEKRVGPGDYLFVPGGHKHWSGGDKTEGALFYQEGSGKFDLIPAK